MGPTTGNLPPIDPGTLFDPPYLERVKQLSRHWVEYGFGAPKITHIIYIAKLLVLYIGGGYLVSSMTSGFSPLHPTGWWTEPIFYQKLVLWTVLLECLGLAGSWGPMAGHFKPFTAGWRTYLRVDTIRQPPWPGKVPFTSGDRRTPLDIALYAALLVSLVTSLALRGEHDAAFTKLGFDGGRVSPALMVLVERGHLPTGRRSKLPTVGSPAWSRSATRASPPSLSPGRRPRPRSPRRRRRRGGGCAHSASRFWGRDTVDCVCGAAATAAGAPADNR
ncbi:MAG: hypothetical protein QOH56_4042 [Pseudonocardiales bacterium]|jgi:hypothetical protein|nr:hypothetical protein [Pseudonocardiales bacterium]